MIIKIKMATKGAQPVSKPDLKVQLPVTVRGATGRPAARELYVGFRIDWCRPFVETFDAGK